MARESTIQIYNSVAGTTSPSDLSQGELAFAGASDSLFIGKNGGATAWIGASILDDNTFATASDTTLATSESIKAYVDGQLGASAGVTQIEGLTGSVDVATVNGVTHSASASTLTIKGITATASELGVAKFGSGLNISDGNVTTQSITLTDDDGDTQAFDLGETLVFTGDNGIETNLTAKGLNTSTVVISAKDATDSVKGVASFASDDFDVSSGAVSLEGTVLKGLTAGGVNITPSTHRIEIGGGTAAVFNTSAAGFTIGIQQATTSQLGVASFNSGDFAVDAAGEVTFIGTTGVSSVTGTNGVIHDTTTGDVTIRGVTASTGGQIGVASFDSTNFSISPSAGVVTIKDGGVDNAELVNSTITFSGPSTSTAISLGGSVGITGTANEVTVSESSGQFTIGLPTNVTIAGDLTVNGTTTTLDTNNLVVEDPMIKLAKNNGANTIDIGFYGLYNDGTDKYTGIVRDATNSKFYLFDSLTSEPGTTTTVGSNGFASATLVANMSGGTF